MKLKCDEPLSNFAFNFNLRLYTEAVVAAGDTALLVLAELASTAVVRCKLTVSKPQVDPGCIRIQGQEYTDIGSDLYRYRVTFIRIQGQMWRCRLTVSKPELKARLVSALETEM